MAGQQLDLPYHRSQNVTNASPPPPIITAFSVYVYNYGFSDFSFRNIIVITDAGGRYIVNSSLVTVRDCGAPAVPGDCSTGTVQPAAKIPVKKFYRLEFTVLDLVSSPVRIALIGTEGRDVSWRV